MLKRWMDTYCEWEEEMLAVLKNPALAEHAPAGYRRKVALKLAALTDIEREQLLRFSLKYKGWRMYAGAARLAVLFCIGGLFLHWAMPGKVSIPESLVLANLLGFSSVVGFIGIWFNYRRMPPPSFGSLLKVLALATTGAVCGAGFATLMDGKPLVETLARTGPKVLLAGLITGAIYAAILASIALWRNREYEALNTRLQLEAEREKLARQVSESQLSLLRAQIEPHFLFNTLGAVQQLAQSGAPKAAELTANLIAFLRASLSEMRQDTVTLADEYVMVDAYLKVMQVRLGERLHFTLDLPQALRSVRLPGMLVLTLVENAIKHGIEPSLRGGEVTVSSRWESNRLTMTVSDTGVGLAPTASDGVGLSNVRERLLLSYGADANLDLHSNSEGGITAALSIPYAPSGNEGATQ